MKIECLSQQEASRWYESLPSDKRIATLSPHYVAADALRDDLLVPHFLGYREGAAFWLHGVHRSPIPELGGLDQQSPYGYGGPVTNSDDAGFLGRAWQCYQESCREQGVLAEFVRLHPMGANASSYGGLTREDRKTVVIDLAPEDLRATYSGRCRTALRKAEKLGVTATLAPRSEIGGRFAEFYREGMRAIGASDFYLFGDAYFRAFEDWRGAELLVCERDGQWLSAGLFLTAGDVMEYHLSATNDEGRKYSATTVLLDTAAQRARARGCTHLYLGGGTDAREDNPLLTFKSSFSRDLLPFSIGFAAFCRERYDALREQRLNQGKPANRFLFYRD